MEKQPPHQEQPESNSKVTSMSLWQRWKMALVLTIGMGAGAGGTLAIQEINKGAKPPTGVESRYELQKANPASPDFIPDKPTGDLRP